MAVRQPTKRFIAFCLISALAIVSATEAPVVSASTHSGARAVAHHSKSVLGAARCKTRNKASGTAEYSDWQFPDTLNPYQTSAAVSYETIASLHDDLVLYDDRSRLFPVLLTQLPSLKNGQIRDGGKTVIATLKQGLKWSNGAEITSADVLFGWKIGMDKNSGPYCSGTCDVIGKIDIRGKYGMIFHLSQKYAPFIPNGLPPVWPVEWKGSWKKNDAATAAKKLFQKKGYNFENSSYPTNGPYYVSQYIRDDRIVLKPMKYYSTMNCGAKIATLIFSFYSSKPGMIAAAATHATDTTTNYTLADIPELRQHAGTYALLSQPGYEIEHLTFNVDKKYGGKSNPLSKTAVRQALALAIDKVGLIRSALGMSQKQVSEVIAWTPLVLSKKLVQPYADSSLKGQWDPLAHKYIVDTGRGRALSDAKVLLQRAGYSHGFSLDGVTTDANPVRVSQFAVIQRGWLNIGVELKPTFVPSTALFASWQEHGVLQRGAFQVAMYDDVGTPDPDSFKFDFQHQYIDREQKVHLTGNSNVTGVHDKSFDIAFDKAAVSYDPKVRQHWYSVWQTGLNQKAYWVPLFYRSQISTVSNRIGNFRPNPTTASNEWNTWEWYLKG